jgi:hypothetical protein
MFKLTSNPTFKRVVKVSAPVDGGIKESTLGVTFKALKVSELQKFDVNSLDGQVAMLKAAIATVDDVEDEAGNVLPYNDDLRDQLIDIGCVRKALILSYDQGIMGAREKN